MAAAPPPHSSDRRALAAWIDHTLLRPEARERDVEILCEEAASAGFAAVCVNPVHVALCRKRLARSGVKVATVVGFPLGATFPEVKAEEARRAEEAGAEELDMVLAVGFLKSGRLDRVTADLEAVARGRATGVLLKVILETSLLTEEEKVVACKLALEAGADFVKTSTGFAKGGATVEDVRLLRRCVGPSVGVKASGGIRTLATAVRMLEAGATRLGTSAGMSLLQEIDE